ncbi:MAG: septum formation initiator family protein [Myxococcota bacterium]
MKALSLATFVIAAFAVSAMLDRESGLEIWLELRSDLAVSGERVERLVRENDALRSEIATLESEPDALDRAIREELDLALPGEIVVRFEPTSARSAVQPAIAEAQP